VKPTTIPAPLAQHAAAVVREWQIATDRFEKASKEYNDACEARLRAERKLTETSRAMSLAIAAATPPPASAPSNGIPTPDQMPPADAILAWMQAGSPTDSDGNMLIPGGS